MTFDLVLRSTRAVLPEGVRPAAVGVRGGRIAAVGDHRADYGAEVDLDLADTALLPGLVDTHVHVNEPGAQGVPAVVEIDTANYKGNAPDHVVLLGADQPGQDAGSDWSELIGPTRMLPDCKHRFRLDGARPVTHLRLEVRPDGGVARLHVFGTLTASGLAAVRARWEGNA